MLIIVLLIGLLLPVFGGLIVFWRFRPVFSATFFCARFRRACIMANSLLWLVSALIFVGLVILIDSNSTQWVFLVRVQWVVLFGLMILPVLAHSFGGELLIGAYELNNRRAGFSCRVVSAACRD